MRLGPWTECDLVPHPADEGTATEKDFAWVCGELLAKAQVGASPPNSQLPALLPDATVAPSEAQQTESPSFILPDIVFPGDSCQACQSLCRV